MKMVYLFLFLFFSSIAYAQLPDAKVRAKMISVLADEMQRLDGEALEVRKKRPTDWQKIKNQLATEAGQATTWTELFHSFARMDQAYPNLHANVQPGHELSAQLEKRIELKVYFMAEVETETQTRYVISYIDPNVTYSKDNMPILGDQLIAINGRPMAEWQKENFEFCKFPLPYQCDHVLSVTLEKEFLSWNRTQNLIFTLKRGSKVWDISVEIQNKADSNHKNVDCNSEINRYPNFQRVYSGNRACIYQNLSDPKTAILRITSFDYEHNEKIGSVAQEVQQLYSWWVNNANWNHLVIDLIDNTGGMAPTEYHQILLHKPFQQIFVSYKKTKEMENDYLREQMFWQTQEQEIWFQSLISNGAWASLNYGDYTPTVPMFCPTPMRNCSEGLFPALSHPFNGKISVLLNQWCVSACDDFVYVLKEQMGSKVEFFGQHQAADTAYSRLAIYFYLDPKSPEGFTYKLGSSYDPTMTNAFLTQSLVLSRAQNQSGKILSGIPADLKEFVPFNFKNYKNWPAEVLSRALK